MDYLYTEHTHLELGPYHKFLPGLFRLFLELDGERIVEGSPQVGFSHRGLEKAFELQTWPACLLYADRLDPESAIFSELVFCLAVEEIGGIAVPPRANAIRLILSEMTRISCHLLYMVKLAKECRAENFVHYVLRDREKILDLFELITGARFSHNYLRFGGVREDITDGFIERVLEVCANIEFRLKEYEGLFFDNSVFLKRCQEIGRVHPEWVFKYGMTGPNARATGILIDVRKDQPYCGYENLAFEVPTSTGDVYGRLQLRVLEIKESIKILKQVVEVIPAGEFLSIKAEKGFKLPRGEAYVRVEGSRGCLGCHVVSAGGSSPERVQFRVPSMAYVRSLSEFLQGMRMEDLPIVLASLDLSMSEVDR